MDDAIVELFGPEQRGKEIEVVKFLMEFFNIPNSEEEVAKLFTKESATELAQQIATAFDLGPDDVFEQDYLMSFVKDNFWDEIHGH